MTGTNVCDNTRRRRLCNDGPKEFRVVTPQDQDLQPLRECPSTCLTFLIPQLLILYNGFQKVSIASSITKNYINSDKSEPHCELATSRPKPDYYIYFSRSNQSRFFLVQKIQILFFPLFLISIKRSSRFLCQKMNFQ